ncbi:MAG: hypothetical protein KDB80_11840, partial [Planctomycetes bacterium]|nr:hypothetical protein [Planctomycetota bacterium]
VFHCHHYNTYLQRSILDAGYVDSVPFLIGAAAEVAFAQLTNVFANANVTSTAQRIELAQELYRWAGFGTFDLSSLNADGGTTSTSNSHYAMAWNAKFGTSDQPVCHFASGWLAGAWAAIQDLPLGTFAVRHDTCRAEGASTCEFELSEGAPNYTVFESVEAGHCATSQSPIAVDQGNVDYAGIYQALTGMEIVGDEAGSISAFGVYLTRHYANYYNRVSFETERAMVQKFGDHGLAAARPLFVEAGHVCAFNTFGGMMTSGEWDALILPSLKCQGDWVHGMTAAVNALGWGRWQVTDLSVEGATFVIHDDYESNGYLGMYGVADHPVSYLAEGAAAGIMNLVYRGDVASKPEFTPEFYGHLFKADGNYVATPESSKAMGDEFTSFRVTRKA